MKCIITGKETVSKSKGNFPLSKEGRSFLQDIKTAHNQKIEAEFIKAAKERNDVLVEDVLKKMSPKISTKYALDLISKQEPDMMETVKEVLGE